MTHCLHHHQPCFLCDTPLLYNNNKQYTGFFEFVAMPLYNSMVMLFGGTDMARHLRQLGVNKNMWKLVALDEERDARISNSFRGLRTSLTRDSISSPSSRCGTDPWIVAGTASARSSSVASGHPASQRAVCLTRSASVATGTDVTERFTTPYSAGGGGGLDDAFANSADDDARSTRTYIPFRRASSVV